MSPPQDAPAERQRSSVLRVITIAVIGLAVVAFVLMYVFSEEAEDPTKTLREFARRIDDRDCDGSYALLAHEARQTYKPWCSLFVPDLDRKFDADFRVEQVVLDGDVADVCVSGVRLKYWRLTRLDGSWRVLWTAGGLVPLDEPIPDRLTCRLV